MVKIGSRPNKNRVKRRGSRSVGQRVRRNREKEQRLEEQRRLQQQTVSESLENRNDLEEFENEETVLPEKSTETSVPLSDPNIVIKEEPIDQYELPSTSRTTREELILPEPDRTPAGHMPALGEAFSVVKTENNGEIAVESMVQTEIGTPNAGQSEKKKGTFIASRNTPIRGVFKMADAGELMLKRSHSKEDHVCVYGQSKKKAKDRFDLYGEYIATKLRKLDWNSCDYVRKAIGDIILAAEMGRFKNRELLERQFNLQL